MRHYAKQLKVGIIPEKFSQPAASIPAWKSLSANERQWESDRMEVFAAMVEVMDTEIGRIIAKLKAKVSGEHAVPVLRGQRRAVRAHARARLKPWDADSYWTYDASWAHAGNTPFRLYKQNQHEGGISSPMIAHWPAGLKAKPGSITHQPGHLIDFMATFLDVGKAKYPKQVGARKVDPLMGKSFRFCRARSVRAMDAALPRYGPRPRQARGSWPAKLGRWELYNLDEDRTELIWPPNIPSA